MALLSWNWVQVQTQVEMGPPNSVQCDAIYSYCYYLSHIFVTCVINMIVICHFWVCLYAYYERHCCKTENSLSLQNNPAYKTENITLINHRKLAFNLKKEFLTQLWTFSAYTLLMIQRTHSKSVRCSLPVWPEKVMYLFC